MDSGNGDTAREDPTGEKLSANPLPRRLGDYELIEELGRGGMGIVFKARQLSLKRVVALKVIRSAGFSTELEISRFRSEAESAANLRHPNIVAIHEIGEVEGEHYFSMEYIEGQNLSDMVSECPLPPLLAARYLERVAEAVEYAHRQGVLHRDLKPSNVMVDERDEPRVTDFGLAKKLTYDSALTLSGQLLGSPNFMPPEQASDRYGHVSAQSDVYGLGALLYHLVTGRPPFQAATIEETLSQVFDKDPASPRVLNPGVPRDLETICLKCLEKNPQRRYSTAQAVAEELGRFERDEPILARPIGLSGKTWRWCRRRPLVASLVAVVIVLLLSLAVGGPIVATRQASLAAYNQSLAEDYRCLSYASDLTAAWQAWSEGNISLTKRLLERHLPDLGQNDLREFTWRYLWNLVVPTLETQPYENPLPVLFSAVSRDGTQFAVSGPLGKVFIWDVGLKRIESTITSECLYPGGVAFSPDGSLLVTTGGGATVGQSHLQVWDISGRDLEYQKPKFEAEFGGSLGEFSPDGQWFAFSSDLDIVILDVQNNWQEADRWRAHSMRIWEVRWSPNGDRLVSASQDHTAAIWAWDTKSHHPVSRLGSHTSHVFSSVFSPDGSIVGTASDDKTVRFWDAATGIELEHMRYRHEAPVMTLAWSRDDRWLASADTFGITRLQNLQTRATWTLRGHLASATNVRFALENSVLISTCLGEVIRFWDLADLPPPNNALQGRVCYTREFSSPLAFSPDSRTIVTVDANGTDLLLWDTATGTVQEQIPISVPQLDPHLALGEDRITHVAVTELVFLSREQLAASCVVMTLNSAEESRRDVIALVDLASKEVTELFPGRRPICVSRDRTYLAMQGEKAGSVRIRDLTTRRTWPEKDESPQFAHRVTSMDFSPDGKSLAVAMMPHDKPAMYLLDVATGKSAAPLFSEARQRPTWDIAFTPGGGHIVSAGIRAHLEFWDAANSEFATKRLGHTSQIRCLAISPDGKTIATGSENGIIKLWGLEQKQELLSIHAHESYVSSLAFSPDGNILASGGKHGKVFLWRAVPEDQSSL